MSTINLQGAVFYALPGVNPVAPSQVPVRGATVHILDFDDHGHLRKEIFTGQTNHNGFFDGQAEVKDFEIQTFTIDPHWEERTETVHTMFGDKTVTTKVWVPVSTSTKQVTLVHVLHIRVEYGPQSTEQPFLAMPTRTLVPVPWQAPTLCLSQDELLPPVRQARIAARRVEYQWGHDYPGLENPSFCAVLPPGEQPLADPLYTTKRGEVMAQVAANTAQVRASGFFTINRIGETTDYTALFPRLPRPGSVDRTGDDQFFVEQRLAGVNPMVIKKATSLPPEFPVTDAHLGGRPGALASALQSGRLYLADYSMLDGIPPCPDGKRYLPAPFALFQLRDLDANHQQLTPVAIQIERRHDDAANPIFTPADGDRWKVAKLMVQVADLNLHEMKSHLFETHLVMEVFVVATARQLDVNHPLSVLLQPHFHLVLHQSDLGRNILMNSGGLVDQLLASGVTGSLEIINRAKRGYRFSDQALPRALALRGLDDPAHSLRDFPYRDDALLVWNAIKRWVQGYVDHYYSSDADVVADREVSQGWFGELTDPARGGLPGVPALNTKQALADVVTQVVFTCSAQHSAVNYPQWDMIGFIPNMPGASWGKPLAPVDPRRPQILLGNDPLARFLPPRDRALSQVELVGGLGLLHYGRLGDYARFQDPAIEQLAQRFRDDLVDIGRQVDRANAGGRILYRYLHPNAIAPSINV